MCHGWCQTQQSPKYRPCFFGGNYKVHSFTCPNYLVNIYTWMLNIYLKSELLIPYTSPIPPNHEPQTYSHCSNGTCLLTVVQAKNIGDNFNVLSFNSPHPIHQKILSSHLQNEFRTFPLLTSSTAAIMAITNLPASSWDDRWLVDWLVDWCM